MKLWEAMMEVNKGNKIRKACWKEGRYVYKNNNGELCWDDEREVIDLSDSDDWEVMMEEEDKHDVHLFWKLLYEDIMMLGDLYQELLNSCGEDACHGCEFINLCTMYENMYSTLEYLAEYYKLEQ